MISMSLVVPPLLFRYLCFAWIKDLRWKERFMEAKRKVKEKIRNNEDVEFVYMATLSFVFLYRRKSLQIFILKTWPELLCLWWSCFSWSFNLRKHNFWFSGRTMICYLYYLLKDYLLYSHCIAQMVSSIQAQIIL